MFVTEYLLALYNEERYSKNRDLKKNAQFLSFENDTFCIQTERTDDTIACFYSLKAENLSFASANEEDTGKCFILDAAFIEQAMILHEIVRELAIDCHCRTDCTMEHGCLFLQKLKLLDTVVEWYGNDLKQAITDAENRIMNWIYGL